MAEPIPCPVCGTEDTGAGPTCSMCGHDLAAALNNVGRGRCARCGAEMPVEHAFCPLCGLDQRARYARPETATLRVQGRRPVRAGHSGPHSVVPREEIIEPVVPPEPFPQHEAVAEPRGAWGYLVVLTRDGVEGDRLPLHRDVVEIGRVYGDVQFEHDPFLSPVHARLERRGDSVDLVDLGSRNGVYLKITRPEPVYPGDYFLVGHQLLRLENVDASQNEQPGDRDGTLQFGTPMTPAWGRVALIGRSGVKGDCYYLRAADVTFGRQNADLVFPADAFLSRQHARISTRVAKQSMSVTLEDLGSANGTFLRLRQRATVGANDTFRIGDQILRIRMK